MTHDAYLAHTSECLGCDPGAGRLCTIGDKLKRRWRRCADAEEGS